MRRGRQKLVEQWRSDADKIGTDQTAIWTRWVHTKALLGAIVESEAARKHHEAFYVINFVISGSMESIVIGIRRQDDENPRAVSLINLLGALVKDPDAYTIDHCRQTFADRARRWKLDRAAQARYVADADLAYTAVADSTGRILDATRVATDIRELKRLCERFRKLANQEIAHRDRTAPKVEVLLGEPDGVMQSLWNLSRKYTRLFDGGAHGGVPNNCEEMRSLYTFPWLPGG